MKSLMSKLLCYLMILVMLSPQVSEAAFTPNKQYNNQATGSNVNTWGITLNSNFTTIDTNLGGTLSLSVAGAANVTLSSAQAQNLIYNLTGLLTGNIVLFFPAQGGFYYVSNQTTGAFTITVKGVGGSVGVVVPQNSTLPIWVDNSTSPPTVTTASFVSPGANSNITSITGLTTPLSAAQGGSTVYVGGTTGGTANAQTLASVTPSNFSLVAGNIVTGIAGASNSSAATLAINGTTATAIRKLTASGLTALTGNEMISGQGYVWYYDGTFYELVNPVLAASAYLKQAFTTETTLASATTTDLGTAASNIVNISGVTTITSFGSSASADNPLYYLKFAGALTLTYNAASLILPGAASITTAAGDAAIAKYEGSGNWRIISYTAASGKAVVPPSLSANTYQAGPANPTGTANTTGLMMGLAGAFTPATSGSVHITICGGITSSSAPTNGVKYQIRYGTGAAPSNAAALTGSTAGRLVAVNPADNNVPTPFCDTAIVTGLTVNTAYWIDISLAAVTAGTAAITDIGISAFEIK